MKTIRIGNAAGFWGDSPSAPRRLVESAELDYLTLEYLAELTMSILAYLRSRDPQAGYVTDFPTVIEDLLPALIAQPELRIVTNAGGMNPHECVRTIGRTLTNAGLPHLRIGCVTGDDLLPRLDELQGQGVTFDNMETGAPLTADREEIVCANAYLGAAGITAALSRDARIVVTGRVADASLTVGPVMHEHGIAANDWPALASATVAGHLIECGAQVTGGMFSGWNEQLPLADVGYPIAEISADRQVTITKPPGSGGRVNVQTVAEQLVYEIGDPAHYLTPDVDVDFRNVTLEQIGEDRVAVKNVAGGPAPSTLKVSMAIRDGYQVSGTLVIAGPDAVPKARASGEMVLDRVRRSGVKLERTNIELLGAGAVTPGIGAVTEDAPEVVLRISAHDPSRESLEVLARELAPLVTSGPPGVTGYVGGRPRPRPVMAFWPTLIPRELAPPHVEVTSAKDWSR